MSAQTQRHKSIRTGRVHTHAKRAAEKSHQQLCTIFSNENAQTTNRTPEKKLTRLKRHEILDGVGKGGSGEGRVWEEGSGKPGKGGGPGDVQGREVQGREVQGRGGRGRRVKEGVHRPTAQIGQEVQVSGV